jgi:hypothetical protein
MAPGRRPSSPQLCDECHLASWISFVRFLHPAFSDAMHHLISLEGPLCCLKRKEAHFWFDRSFEKTMVLLNGEQVLLLLIATG